jgi:hypothetical protein
MNFQIDGNIRGTSENNQLPQPDRVLFASSCFDFNVIYAERVIDFVTQLIFQIN